MAGLSDIAGRCARLLRRQRVGGFVFDTEWVGIVVGMRVVAASLPFLPPSRAFGREGADVETLSKQVNALQEGEALHQPANAVMHGEPGFVGCGMTVAAPPATDRLLERWGETALAASPTFGSRIGRHGRILIPGRAAPPVSEQLGSR